MLNEKIEYAEYTTNTRNARLNQSRFSYGLLGKSQKGIKNPFSIIARKFYYEYTEDCDDKVYCTRQALLAWCGMDYCADCEKKSTCRAYDEMLIIHANSLIYLINILEALCEKSKINVDKGKYPIKDCLDARATLNKAEFVDLNALADLDFSQYKADKHIVEAGKVIKSFIEKAKKYNDDDIFATIVSKPTDSQNATNFNDILADAIAKGELKRYYLVARTNEFASLKSELQKNHTESKYPDDNMLTTCIAAYFLGKTNNDQNGAFVNQSDIASWQGKNNINKINEHKLFFNALNKDKSASGTKWFVDPRYEDMFNACEFMLLDENDKEIQNYMQSKEHIVFCDTGFKTCLERNMFY